MADLASVAGTAAGAFVGTNIDDFVVLLLLVLGMPKDGIRRWQIVIGQYVGFAVLLALGVRGLIQAGRAPGATGETPILAAGVAKVAVVTVANGGDNVSVYTVLFRQLNPAGTAVTILVFLIMLGGLCALALAVGQHARLIPRIVRGNKWFTPSVYVIIGAVLLVRTGALAHLASLT